MLIIAVSVVANVFFKVDLIPAFIYGVTASVACAGIHLAIRIILNRACGNRLGDKVADLAKGIFDLIPIIVIGGAICRFFVATALIAPSLKNDWGFAAYCTAGMEWLGAAGAATATWRYVRFDMMKLLARYWSAM